MVGKVATASYSYAMYTASDHMWKGKKWWAGMLERRSAVGIVDGCAAVDLDAEDKQLREKFFSMELLLKGTQFESKLGKASVEADRVRIIDDIGAKSTELDRCVQGKVATGGLMRAVGTQYCEQFMEKVRQGKVRKLQLDLKTYDEAFTEQVCELWKGFDASKLEELRVNNLQGPTDWLPTELLSQCAVLIKMDLQGCSISALPESIGDCKSLTELNLRESSISALPESIGNCKSLTELDLRCCSKLQLSDHEKEQLEANKTRILK